MIWNAPIWLNQVLLNIIMFILQSAVIISVVTPFIIIYFVIEELILKKTLRDILKGKQLVTLLSSLAISIIALVIFFLPQPIMKEKYEISVLWINEYQDGLNK